MNCPRCSKPTKGQGKTRMCRTCAACCSTRKLKNTWGTVKHRVVPRHKNAVTMSVIWSKNS